VARDESARTLYDKHMGALYRLLQRSLPRLRNGTSPRHPQNQGDATYCARRTPDDGYIDWDGSAHQIWTLIRASGEPYPGAYTYVNGRILRIWSADLAGPLPYVGQTGQVQVVEEQSALVRCGDGEHLRLSRVQFEEEPIRTAAETLKKHQRLGLLPWQLLPLAERARRC
jgi:methionyl-tRNA formyltransferase